MAHNWDNLKRVCDREAVSDAEEGENRRAEWTSKGLQERYDKKYRERRQQIEATQAREEALAPLQQIEREADALTYSDNSEVRELASLIQRLTEYLIAKESM